MIPPAATPGKGREGKDYARGNSYWYGVQGCDLKGGRRRKIADNDVQGLMLVLATVPLVACESLRPQEALPSAPVATSTNKPAAKSAQTSSTSAPTSAPITDSASPSAASIVPQAERTSPAAFSPEPSSRPLPSRETANKATEERKPATATATTTAAVSGAAEKSVAELSGPSSQSSASSRSTSRPLPSAASASASSSVAAPPHLYSPSPTSPPLVSQPKIITKSTAAVTADSSACGGEDDSLFDCEQSYSSSSKDQVQTTLIIVFSFRSPIASMDDIVLDVGSSNRSIRLQHNDKATTVQLLSSIHADSIQAKFSKKKNQLKVQGVCV
jgi:hypothetical protein